MIVNYVEILNNGDLKGVYQAESNDVKNLIKKAPPDLWMLLCFIPSTQTLWCYSNLTKKWRHHISGDTIEDIFNNICPNVSRNGHTYPVKT